MITFRGNSDKYILYYSRSQDQFQLLYCIISMPHYYLFISVNVVALELEYINLY